MFKNPFSFNGRIRRLEFGLSYIIYIITALILGNIADAIDLNGLELILFIPLFWFLLAQGAKRCHDRGNSGWFIFIPFYVFWMLFADSIQGTNEYGPNPKGIGNYDEIDEIGSDIAP